jgi:hypothetical protein
VNALLPDSVIYTAKVFLHWELSPFFTIQHHKWNDFLYDIKGPYKNNCQYHQYENEISISEEKI